MKKVEVGKDAAIEAEVKAARERAVVPVEIRMKQFRDMLAEKEVSYNGGLIIPVKCMRKCALGDFHLRRLCTCPAGFFMILHARSMMF